MLYYIKVILLNGVTEYFLYVYALRIYGATFRRIRSIWMFLNFSQKTSLVNFHINLHASKVGSVFKIFRYGNDSDIVRMPFIHVECEIIHSKLYYQK